MYEKQKDYIKKYEEDKIRMNVRIDKVLATKMDLYCKLKNISKKEFIEKAIMEYIDRN